MRYLLAAVIPIGFVVTVFSVLAILTAMADVWSVRAKDVLTEVVVWWAREWWLIGIVLAAICLIVATVQDAHAPAKRTRR